MRTIVVAGVLVLAACASTAPVSPADVAALETSVTIAETLAADYTRLPPCPIAKQATACADPATKVRIKADGAAAYAAVVALRQASAADAPAAYDAAVAALAALEAATPPAN